LVENKKKRVKFGGMGEKMIAFKYVKELDIKKIRFIIREYSFKWNNYYVIYGTQTIWRVLNRYSLVYLTKMRLKEVQFVIF
jgi:hypothetical protein